MSTPAPSGQSDHKALRVVFARHPRRWRDNLYVYPVISRRAHGLSIGVNLNPDMACNFDCVYCCVDRTQTPRTRRVDLDVLRTELRTLVANRAELFEQPEFSEVPAEYRRLNDLAFSGDGEPTACPVFPQAVQLAIDVRREFDLSAAKIVIITDACFLTRPAVAAALALLEQHNGEIWAKLDAGTEEYFRQIARPSHSLAHVLENILAAARVRPIVIQSLFLQLDGVGPAAVEIDAYIARLGELLAQGAQLKLVQVYTVARRTAERGVSALSAAELEQIAARVRALGLQADVFA